MPDERFSYRVPRVHGPRIAVIGGGNGLSTMLRGLKNYTGNITALVTVADAGGGAAVAPRAAALALGLLQEAPQVPAPAG